MGEQERELPRRRRRRWLWLAGLALVVVGVVALFPRPAQPYPIRYSWFLRDAGAHEIRTATIVWSEGKITGHMFGVEYYTTTAYGGVSHALIKHLRTDGVRVNTASGSSVIRSVGPYLLVATLVLPLALLTLWPGRRPSTSASAL